MPGKSKDCKANKGRKALQSEWDDAVSAAASGDPLITSAVNIVRKGAQSGPSSVYVAQAAGGNAKDRLRKYEEALVLAERESKAASDLAALSLKDGSVLDVNALGKELSERELLKAKKKKEKEDAKAFEQRAEEERRKRAVEKEEKLKRLAEEEEEEEGL